MGNHSKCGGCGELDEFCVCKSAQIADDHAGDEHNPLADCLKALRTAWHISGVVQGREDIARAIERAESALAIQPPTAPVLADERANWKAWYFDHDRKGSTFGYQDTLEGHFDAFERKSEEAWLARAAQQAATCQPTLSKEEIYTLRRVIECAEKLDERPRPMCRDCADENGTCPNSGLECDMHKLFTDAKALHNRLAAPTCQGGAQQAGWISVKDALPKTEHECTSRDLMVSNSFYVRGVAVDGGEGFGMADYQEDGKWHCYGGDYDFMHITEVTHYLPIRPGAAPVPVAVEDARDADETQDKLDNALWFMMQHAIHRYLMANAHGRWDGAEKATRHMELCQMFLAVEHGCIDLEEVRIEHNGDYEAVHTATQKLTDHLDEVIGFPLEETPDYDLLAPLFFDQFITLARATMSSASANGGKEGE